MKIFLPQGGRTLISGERVQLNTGLRGHTDPNTVFKVTMMLMMMILMMRMMMLRKREMMVMRMMMTIQMQGFALTSASTGKQSK